MEREEVGRGLSNIGERIARARRDCGFTRREMGEMAGVDEGEVRSWEETLSRPGLCQVKELAARCGTTPDWLLGRDLIEEVVLEQSKHSYVCLGGRALEDLPLVGLDDTREFILWVWRQPHRQSNQAGDVKVPAEPPAGREAEGIPRQRPGPTAK